MWPVMGQERAVSLLRRSLEKGVVAHAYLFVGPPHVGKMTLALGLSQALNCEEKEPPCGQCPQCRRIASLNHADTQIIGLASADDRSEVRAPVEISIEQIRQLQHSASLSPFEGKYKVFIIEGAERLSTGAANCLLKTLEEPPDRVVFVLLTEDEGLLPATVVSRCQRLKLHPIAIGEVEEALISNWGIQSEKAKLLARLSHGRLGWAVSAAGDEKLMQQRAQWRHTLLDIMEADYEERFSCAARLATQFGRGREGVWGVLDLWLDLWRDLMLAKLGLNEVITNLDLESELTSWVSDFTLVEIRDFISCLKEAKQQLKQNANARLVLEVMMLNMPRRKGGVSVNNG